MIHDLPAGVAPLIAELDLSYLLGQVKEAVVYADRDFVVRYANDVYLQGLKLTATDVIGKTPFEYLPSFRRSVFYEVINECHRLGRPHAAINYSVATNRWVLLRAMPCNGGALVLANDASEDMLKQFQLAQRATLDPLTGIANKVALVEQLDARLASGSPFSLAIIGLSRFGTVNDTIGFAGGDRVLVEIASRLQSASVDGEFLCRLNGDEFAVLAQHAGPEFNARVDALLVETRRAIQIQGHTIKLGSSAGLIASTQHEGSSEALLNRAALALRQCKRDGTRHTVWYEDHMETSSRRRAENEDELRKAIQEGAFTLALQPKGDMLDRRVVGAEALIRWPHPVRGVIPPADFLPIAEDCGLMVDIDRWVIKTALEHIAELKRLGLAIPVSINLSVQSLSDPNLVGDIQRALVAAGVEPALLEIEIPEGALMRDVATSSQVLNGLAALGIVISIDDFGTGYSSFAYLAKFPVSTLKIDRSFVDEMSSNTSSRKIVKGLIQLAHSLSMKVVAEGVETEQQMNQLSAMHCDEIQGFGYGRPMPFEQFCHFVETHRGGSRPNPLSI
jgi:diguanylate cyclase (GGDEF)-like protein